MPARLTMPRGMVGAPRLIRSACMAPVQICVSALQLETPSAQDAGSISRGRGLRDPLQPSSEALVLGDQAVTVDAIVTGREQAIERHAVIMYLSKHRQQGVQYAFVLRAL